jgi:hypothetical protein
VLVDRCIDRSKVSPDAIVHPMTWCRIQRLRVPGGEGHMCRAPTRGGESYSISLRGQSSDLLGWKGFGARYLLWSPALTKGL